MGHQKIVVIVWALALGAGTVAVCADEEPTWRFDGQYSSREVVHGVRRAGAAWETAAELTGGAWRGNFASAVPFDAGEERRATLGAAYRWTAGEDFQVETSVQHRWAARGLAAEAKHTWLAGLAATGPSRYGFTPMLSYARDLRRQADVVEAGLARSFPLTRLGAFFDTRVFAGWASGAHWQPDVPGPQRQDSYRYWGAEAQVPYRVGAHTTLKMGLHYTAEAGRSAVNGPGGLAKGGNFWATLGVSFDF
jgi:hypothetical protein